MSKRLMSVLLLSMVICSTGCDTSPNNQAEDESNSGPPKIEVNGPLRLLVLDDESLATVLEREWRAISSHDMVVTNVVSKDVLSQLDAGQKMQATDVVIFPSRMLGELIAKRLLRPTPSELMSEPEYQNGEIFSLIRRRETQWNRQPYSVSFGSPSLVLLRRTDLVPQAPTTWAELDAEAKRLKDSLPGEIMSLAQPFADGWASHLLLVRAAPYAYDSSRVSTLFGFSTMEPRIATAPFIRAAEELADSLQDGRHDLTPATVLKEFLEGKAAMAITWPSAFRSESEVPIDFPVEVTELPGSREWYEDSELRELEGDDISNVSVLGIEGRLGAVSRSAKNGPLANIFLAWATNPSQSPKLCTRSSQTAPFRISHSVSADEWIDQSLPREMGTTYYEVVKQSLSRSKAIQFPRLPGQHRYMETLDLALRKIVIEKQSVKECLDSAAANWKSITSDYGLEAQKSSYRMSLGIRTDR